MLDGPNMGNATRDEHESDSVAFTPPFVGELASARSEFAELQQRLDVETPQVPPPRGREMESAR